MRIIILGSGTGIPMSYRASPSLAVFTGDNPMLFDMGPGSLRQLARIGINHSRIEKVFITHFHPDHTADLIQFLFVTREPKILENRRPFTIAGPAGIGTFIRKLRDAYGKWLDIPERIMRIEELDIHKPETRSYDGYEIISRPVIHTPNSLAYRIHGKAGESVVYSGDTSFCDEIVDLARDCDLLVLESSFPEGEAVEGHLTPSEAGRIATMARVKKLLLIHFYPEALRKDIAGECRKAYKGELILGRDMLTVSI
jgi:ribonuclease BN (tRNA processing enzyme)